MQISMFDTFILLDQIHWGLIKMTKKFSLLRMLQNSRESGAINIDCVDPLGELNQPPLGVTSFFWTIFHSICYWSLLSIHSLGDQSLRRTIYHIMGGIICNRAAYLFNVCLALLGSNNPVEVFSLWSQIMMQRILSKSRLCYTPSQ